MTGFFDTLVDNWDRLLEGTWVTVQLSLGGAALAFAVAVLLGLAAISGSAILATVSRIVVEFFRGTSLVVQLFYTFYVFPLFGLSFDALTCGVLALGLNYGAYGSEVVRGSLIAVPRGQWETTTALSMSWLTKVRRIIWPQAWALMLPGLNNLMVMLVKGTAIALLITLYDLTYVTEDLRSSGVDLWSVFGIAFLIYYLLALGFSSLLRLLEIRAQRRLGLRTTSAQATRVTARAVA